MKQIEALSIDEQKKKIQRGGSSLLRPITIQTMQKSNEFDESINQKNTESENPHKDATPDENLNLQVKSPITQPKALAFTAAKQITIEDEEKTV